jgi:YVTN family beta-propeller protein
MKCRLSPARWLPALLLMSCFGEAGALPFAYITNSNDNTVSVIDAADNIIAATISVGDFPYGVVVNSAGTAVYVTNVGPPFTSTLSVIDPSLNAETAEVSVGFAPQGVAVSPDGTRVFVTAAYGSGSSKPAGPGKVLVMDAASQVVIASIDVGKEPQGIAVSPDGHSLYVANHDQPLGTVAVIDIAAAQVIKNVTVGRDPQGLAVTPDGEWVYVANGCAGVEVCTSDQGAVIAPGSVSVIDTTTLQVVATIAANLAPFGVAVTPDGAQVLVTNTASDDVWIIDTSTNGVLGTVALDEGSSPRGIAITRDGMTAYVANNGTDSVSIVDVDAQDVITSIPVGSGPIALGNFIGPACLSNADCDDGNPCTDDRCDFQLGCVRTYNSAPCDDGNGCTASDSCQDGVCVGSGALADGTSCDDGNACTGNDACHGGTCVGQAVDDGSPCDDADACTTSDACQGGVCVGGPPPNCDDGNDCTVDSCDPATGCVHELPGDVVGAGSVSLVFASQPIPQPYSGTITFNDTAYNFNCQAVNLARTVGTQTITGTVLSIDGTTGTGTSVFHTESSPPDLLSDDGSATFMCPSAVPSGSCTGPASFVGTLSNVTGSAALPGNLTYTFDGFVGHPDIGTYVGKFALNAFAPVDTPEGGQVVVSSDTTFFNPAIAGTPGLGSPVVPIKTHLRYSRVLKRGKTLVTAASNAAHTVPQDMWDMPPDVKTNYLTTNYAIESGGFRGTILKPSTTAQVNNPITVCSNYEDADDDGVLDGTSMSVSRLRLMRSQNKTFVDVTSRLDVAAHLVCAQVNSLATFATAVYTGELGYVPPDPGSLSCENRVAAKVKALAKSLTACRTRAVKQALKGKPFDEGGCESAAEARYNNAIARFIATCPACLQNKVALIRDQVESSVDHAKGNIYCAANATDCENAVAKKLSSLTSTLTACRKRATTKGFYGSYYDQQKCESAAKSAYSEAVSRFIGGCPPCLQANQSLIMNAAVSSLDNLMGEVYCAQ